MTTEEPMTNEDLWGNIRRGFKALHRSVERTDAKIETVKKEVRQLRTEQKRLADQIEELDEAVRDSDAEPWQT